VIPGGRGGGGAAPGARRDLARLRAPTKTHRLGDRSRAQHLRSAGKVQHELQPTQGLLEGLEGCIRTKTGSNLKVCREVLQPKQALLGVFGRCLETQTECV
jgi:hypothetical protein